ncbi:MAG: glycosyl hydrolase [Thermoguttaceae bacterium]
MNGVMRHLVLALGVLLPAWPALIEGAEAPKSPASAPAAVGGVPATRSLAEGFSSPPASARPWVYWFWINGNISKEGITADLEAMQRVGVGGVLWMEVSGPWWAPDGKMKALSPEWHEAIQWAVKECDRLGLEFDLSVDFGYGSGGPHVTPDLSMQKLYWSETEVEGGKTVTTTLPKPSVAKNLSAWLRPGAQISPKVVEAIEKSDGYRDVAVLAIPSPASAAAATYRIGDLNAKSGLAPHLGRGKKTTPPPPDCGTPLTQVMDLTGRMAADGQLAWEAPPGKWLVVRFGHGSNFKMTRPSPAAAVGLECDRLGEAGIDAHYDAFLKPIFEHAGASAGKALTYVHIDSWEAGGQNWTASFPQEFLARRGYDLRPWMPVLSGRVVGNAELSDRFLWDLRTTAGELIRENYAGRLRELAARHGIRLSIEAYGNLSIDCLAYAGVSDLPISEFWARGDGQFPGPGGYETSTRAMASAAHTYGKPVVAAESFTSDRGWRDHPYLLKGMGDKKFCEGLNRMIFHLSAHQAYDNMIPGLTHRKWGEHFQRYNTWWDYSRPWLDYLSRCQYLLQQGQFVADVCCWFGEGSPLNVDEMSLEMPPGYDLDFCSAESVLAMRVEHGRVALPSGMSYRYLVLPDTDRMTLPMTRKIRELVDAGAHVIGQRKPVGSPGLAGYPACDTEIAAIGAELWDSGRVVAGRSLGDVFKQDGLPPDFEGDGLLHIHRRIGEADLYFVSNQAAEPLDRVCLFRVEGKRPELWDPESGEVRPLPDFERREGRVAVPLHFEPLQSWFVVFEPGDDVAAPQPGRNYTSPRRVRAVEGDWQVAFDPRWGGPEQPVRFERLGDWSQEADPRVHYYSGTARYRKTLMLSATDVSANGGRLALNLGKVEVMARVKVNGTECGIAWKPPYVVEISGAARQGANELEIDVVNLWINRMIGDEQLPEDSVWKDFETLAGWPEWFTAGRPRPSGRYTFTSCRHYRKDSPLVPSGLLGPVRLERVQVPESEE